MSAVDFDIDPEKTGKRYRKKTNNEIFHVGHRARIWAFLRLNEGKVYTAVEISQATRLKMSTVGEGLKFVKTLPRINTVVTYELQNDEKVKVTKYGFLTDERPPGL